MPALVPNRFLFRFEFPVYRWQGAERLTGDLSRWPPRCELPALHLLDGQAGFGRVFVAWSDAGLRIGCIVRGKRRPPRCDLLQFRKSDHLRIMTDMRPARDVRRATKFCQQFYLMPRGGGKGGREPIGGGAHIARARDDAPSAKPGEIPMAANVDTDGYMFEALLPVRLLAGLDPQDHPRIGFYYILEDSELGQQSLTVGDDLNWWMDPSTWATAVLSSE